ncbi:MAG: hypothetical protein ACI9BW_000538 [Gammaproteobacteria bacterium]|jgi:hypothetical protein
MLRTRKLLYLVLCFAILTVVLIKTGRPLITSSAPLGVVSWQLAFSETRARQVIESWGEEGHRAALNNLIVDFPYLITYTRLLSLLCKSATHPPNSRLNGLSAPASRYVWFAALFDAIENIALLYELEVGVSDLIARIAGVAASVKFSVIALALIFLFSSYVSPSKTHSRWP